jgi:hypothetical protein
MLYKAFTSQRSVQGLTRRSLEPVGRDESIDQRQSAGPRASAAPDSAGVRGDVVARLRVDGAGGLTSL